MSDKKFNELIVIPLDSIHSTAVFRRRETRELVMRILDTPHDRCRGDHEVAHIADATRQLALLSPASGRALMGRDLHMCLLNMDGLIEPTPLPTRRSNRNHARIRSRGREAQGTIRPSDFFKERIFFLPNAKIDLRESCRTAMHFCI